MWELSSIVTHYQSIASFKTRGDWTLCTGIEQLYSNDAMHIATYTIYTIHTSIQSIWKMLVDRERPARENHTNIKIISHNAGWAALHYTYGMYALLAPFCRVQSAAIPAKAHQHHQQQQPHHPPHILIFKKRTRKELLYKIRFIVLIRTRS